MIRRVLCGFSLAMLLSGAVLFGASGGEAGWQVGFGKGVGEVGYDNASVHPRNEEASALGPMAFRLNGNDAWVLDSINGRILQMGGNGKVIKTLRLSGLASNTLLEDLALIRTPKGVVEKIWVGDGADLSLRLIRVSDGIEEKRFGGPGDQPGRFLQIHQLEIDSLGHLYVGDYGRSVISVLDENGKLVREFPWERSGFAIDARDQLSVISWSETAGYLWRQYNPKGYLLRTVQLGQGAAQNPRLWTVTPQGNIVVSFVPAGGFRGVLNLYNYDRFGAVSAKRVFSPTAGMNRFLEVSPEGETVLAKADFAAAPKGRFQLQLMKSEVEK